MRTHLPKLLIILGCIILLVLTAIFIEPPQAWQSAATWQILIVFVPILLFFTFVVDLFLKYLPRSFIIGLGLMFILVLQAINLLTLAVALEVLAVALLAAKLFPKIPPPRFLRRLTLRTKIPKLSKIGDKRK